MNLLEQNKSKCLFCSYIIWKIEMWEKVGRESKIGCERMEDRKKDDREWRWETVRWERNERERSEMCERDERETDECKLWEKMEWERKWIKSRREKVRWEERESGLSNILRVILKLIKLNDI